MNKIYTASPCDVNGEAFIYGPGNPFGYSAGTLWPDSRFATFEDALKAEKLVNEAYKQGHSAALYAVRQALGLK